MNVLIIRLPKSQSILGFSKCPKCGEKIRWYDNIPVLSFFILGGRCRNCRSNISRQYPLVELASGLLFIFLFSLYGENPVFLAYIIFLASLIILTGFIDLKHFLILDSIVLLGLTVFLLYSFGFGFNSPPASILSSSWIDSALGSLLFAGFFLFLFVITRGKGIGLGDVNLALLFGLVFGLKNSASVLFLTFFIGFVWAIILLVSKRAGLKSKMPLGSAMAAAAIMQLAGFNLIDFVDFELVFRLWQNY